MSRRAHFWIIILIQWHGPVVGQTDESKENIAIKLGRDPNRLYSFTVAKGSSVEDALALIGTGIVLHDSVVLRRQKTAYVFEDRALRIGIDDLQLMEGDEVLILPSAIQLESLAQGGVNVILGPPAIAAVKRQYPTLSSGMAPPPHRSAPPTEAPKSDPPPRPAGEPTRSPNPLSEESLAKPPAEKADASDRLRSPREAVTDRSRPWQAFGVAGAVVGMTVFVLLFRRLRGRPSSKA